MGTGSLNGVHSNCSPLELATAGPDEDAGGDDVPEDDAEVEVEVASIGMVVVEDVAGSAVEPSVCVAIEGEPAPGPEVSSCKQPTPTPASSSAHRRSTTAKFSRLSQGSTRRLATAFAAVSKRFGMFL